MRVRWWVGCFVLAAGPARAECTGGGCLDGLAQLVQAVVAYGLIGIVLLVLLIVPRWRKVGVRGLLLVLGLAVGVPVLSLAWQRVQLWWMETGEVLGDLPRMAAQTPLLIAEDWTCESGLCSAVLQGRGATGVTALPIGALEGRDMGAPLVLAELPLEHWSQGEGGTLRRRVLSEVERTAAAPKIDYLILSRPIWYGAGPGSLEQGLDLGKGVVLRLGMAPVTGGAGRIAWGELTFDYLDLALVREALGIPLAPGNWTTVWNDPMAPDLVARSLCGRGAAEPDWACTDAAWR